MGRFEFVARCYEPSGQRVGPFCLLIAAFEP
jgi:hypothetical protein